MLNFFNANEVSGKVKEMMDGKQQVKALHTTDWNTKEKLVYWREQWAHYANLYLGNNGFSEIITHLSNKDRGIETLPTIHEGFVARQMQKNGKKSDRIQMNQSRKEYNQNDNRNNFIFEFFCFDQLTKANDRRSSPLYKRLIFGLIL